MKSQLKAKGFTIVELLTVMGIIVVLISLLLPALSMVRDFSREIQQKAQFHSIEVGIGMYEHDFGTLPPSQDNVDMFGNTWNVPDYDGNTNQAPYSGAMKLAEAMVGGDLLGFHPSSGFYSDAENRINGNMVDVYSADSDQANWQTIEENLDARKGPYIDLENANAFRIRDIYNALGNFVNPSIEGVNDGPLVLCDVFSQRRGSGQNTGMPVLYFRARTRFSQQDYENYNPDTNPNNFTNRHQDDIYYLGDNIEIIEGLGVPGQTYDHPLIDNSDDGRGVSEFQRMILNDKVTSIKRPYRASSYILWSAGKDGLFGTADDIFNFDSIKE